MRPMHYSTVDNWYTVSTQKIKPVAGIILGIRDIILCTEYREPASQASKKMLTQARFISAQDPKQ